MTAPFTGTIILIVIVFHYAPLQHMAALKEGRESQRRYINESKSRPPSGDVIQARLNELPPELEEADWSDDIDGSKDDVIESIKNLPI